MRRDGNGKTRLKFNSAVERGPRFIISQRNACEPLLSGEALFLQFYATGGGAGADVSGVPPVIYGVVELQTARAVRVIEALAGLSKRSYTSLAKKA